MLIIFKNCRQAEMLKSARRSVQAGMIVIIRFIINNPSEHAIQTELTEMTLNLLRIVKFLPCFSSPWSASRLDFEIVKGIGSWQRSRPAILPRELLFTSQALLLWTIDERASLQFCSERRRARQLLATGVYVLAGVDVQRYRPRLLIL